MMTELQSVKISAPIRTNNDLVESASVTALMRYLLSGKTGREKNPDYLGNLFVNGKWKEYLEDVEESYKVLQKKLPGCIYYHLIRTKHFDHSLLDWIKRFSDSQVIILGAGFDSRAIRFEAKLHSKNIHIYEVDLRALLDYKQQIIQNELDMKLDHVTYVSCNFQKDNVIDLLKKAGFNPNCPTLVLWEGVTYFLTEKNVSDYFNLFKSNVTQNVQVTFDYDFRDFIEGDLNFYGGKELHQLTTDELGEPHFFGLNYNEVENYAINHGYYVKSNYTSFMLEALYLRDSFGCSVGTPHGFVGIAEIATHSRHNNG